MRKKQDEGEERRPEYFTAAFFIEEDTRIEADAGESADDAHVVNVGDPCHRVTLHVQTAANARRFAAELVRLAEAIEALP
jgi:hypothetical protein